LCFKTKTLWEKGGCTGSAQSTLGPLGEQVVLAPMGSQSTQLSEPCKVDEYWHS